MSFRLSKIKLVNGYQYVTELLMNIICHDDINQIGQKRNSFYLSDFLKLVFRDLKTHNLYSQSLRAVGFFSA